MRSRKIIENEKRRKDFSKVLLADWRSFIALVYSVEAIACSGLRGCFASLPVALAAAVAATATARGLWPQRTVHTGRLPCRSP
jgi:hypothetical protein